jgi:tRNA(Ile)-lysidine synthase
LRALRLAARHLAGTLDGLERVHLLALVDLVVGDVGGRMLHLPTGLRASRLAERIVLWTGDLPEHAVYALPLLDGTDDGRARLTPDWIWLSSRGQCGSPSEKSGTRFHEHVRYTDEALVLRAARPGETFQPLGMSTGKRVGDFLADRKVPPLVRPRVPLLTVADEPAWLMGWRIDDRWKVLQQDAPIVCLRCARAAPSQEELHT